MHPAQLPAAQPPPVTALIWPSELLEKAANTDSCLLDSLSHSGQGASSSIWLNDRSRSNLLPQTVHPYSYIGI